MQKRELKCISNQGGYRRALRYELICMTSSNHQRLSHAKLQTKTTVLSVRIFQKIRSRAWSPMMPIGGYGTT